MKQHEQPQLIFVGAVTRNNHEERDDQEKPIQDSAYSYLDDLAPAEDALREHEQDKDHHAEADDSRAAVEI